MRYVCSVCGYVYDEDAGIPSAGITPGTRWEDLPDDWTCPLCGASKSEFSPESEKPAAAPEPKQMPAPPADDEFRELSSAEISVLCSNLARGCEKQYKPEEAAAFTRLAEYFRSRSAVPESPSFDSLLEKINADLESGAPAAEATASANGDRGALRCLVWSGKVTRILKSLIARYGSSGGQLPENTGVYVCTICGFVYVGDQLPEVCPVCKVPNRKFEKIAG